ncbi:Uncharacterized membrane protein YsdA, DUF1294 family [Anaerosphaera aminiphila DSM 21120]|uniref:Uncharacterized membrane protein YsdA, DUF1294 family n=1 Tax=Anaerosphaera aminiphila DSM 21120 TaxID=1120995 RepID=A0A1M5S3D5_9FIRM|nr:DUF1294 domain-containing protein [Anaerosphaera aminiphila]SHH33152.1 Uncharacterized membrane protein YsdA, DUF1294 family [Anaerosphaera aminiphila DSM 21120]
MFQLNKYFLYYLIFINIFSFILFYIDKRRAVKNNTRNRISENNLLLSAFLFGSLGALIAMLLFHHKTKKLKFKILVPLFLIVQVIGIYYFKVLY